MKKKHFIWATIIYSLSVLYLAFTTPITSHEAKLLFDSSGIVNYLMELGQSFIQGFFGFRIFFIFSGFLAILFFYEFARRYFPKKNGDYGDAYLATIIFMLLPGIITGSVLSNIAILVLPLVLLFVLLYEKKHFILLPFIMLILFFIHDASIIFFIAIMLYGLIHKDKRLTITAATFLIAFIVMAKGIEIGGRPSGHFIDIFGLYAAVFSPLVFLYFFYTMYRTLLRGKKTLTWYISFTALVFSLLLSIRQKVHISDFAPYVTISIVLMLDIFNHSIRVRLPEFKKKYTLSFNVLMGSLLISASIIFLHQFTFYINEDPQKYFANRVYRPYLLAQGLKNKGIECYDSKRSREQYQLMYYGIGSCTK